MRQRAHTRVSIIVAGALLLVACGGDDGRGDDGDGGDGATDAAAVDASGQAGRDAGPDAGIDCDDVLFPGVESGVARALAADQTHVYMLTAVTGQASVWSIARRDGGGELLATLPLENANGLLLAGDSLYVSGTTNDQGGLFRVSTAGAGDPEPVSSDPVAGLALDATHIYWLASSFEPDVEPAIKRQPLAGGDEEVLVQGAAEIGSGARMAILGDHLYWNREIELRRMAASGGASELFDHLGPQGPEGSCELCLDEMVAADDGRLYWYDVADRTFFYRTGAAAFERELLGADSILAVSMDLPIFVFDGQIYWNAGGEIGHVPTSGGETEVLSTGGSVRVFLPTPAGFLVAGIGGELRLIPLDGCPD